MRRTELPPPVKYVERSEDELHDQHEDRDSAAYSDDDDYDDHDSADESDPCIAPLQPQTSPYKCHVFCKRLDRHSREPGCATAGIKIPLWWSALGTSHDSCLRDCLKAWPTPSSSPVMHVEIGFEVPCGGEQCQWPGVMFNHRMRTPCDTVGKPHMIVFAVYDANDYSIRATIDREFDSGNADGETDYAEYIVPMAPDGHARAMLFALGTLRWCTMRTNEAYNELRDPSKPAIRPPEMTMFSKDAMLLFREHQAAREAQESVARFLPAKLARNGVVSGLVDIVNLLGAMVTSPYKTPNGLYNNRGFFCNMCPCRCFWYGVTRNDLYTSNRAGERSYCKTHVEQPLLCSEFVAAILIVGGIEIRRDPRNVTPAELGVLVETLLLNKKCGVGCPPTKSRHRHHGVARK